MIYTEFVHNRILRGVSGAKNGEKIFEFDNSILGDREYYGRWYIAVSGVLAARRRNQCGQFSAFGPGDQWFGA